MVRNTGASYAPESGRLIVELMHAGRDTARRAFPPRLRRKIERGASPPLPSSVVVTSVQEFSEPAARAVPLLIDLPNAMDCTDEHGFDRAIHRRAVVRPAA